ncbi:MAG: hypothetical protein RLZZ241_1129, partial [Bacteroidota bacterium]
CSKDGSGPESNPNLELAIGTWRLTELNIAPEQDIDEDGQSTTNIMDELNCISGTLQLNADYSWTFSGTDVVITTITGGLFKFFCSESPRTAQGIWDINGNGIRLADDVGNLTNFVLDTEEILLINTIGNSLPGLQAEVYSKN